MKRYLLLIAGLLLSCTERQDLAPIAPGYESESNIANIIAFASLVLAFLLGLYSIYISNKTIRLAEKQRKESFRPDVVALGANLKLMHFLPGQTRLIDVHSISGMPQRIFKIVNIGNGIAQNVVVKRVSNFSDFYSFVDSTALKNYIIRFLTHNNVTDLYEDSTNRPIPSTINDLQGFSKDILLNKALDSSSSIEIAIPIRYLHILFKCVDSTLLQNEEDMDEELNLHYKIEYHDVENNKYEKNFIIKPVLKSNEIHFKIVNIHN